MGSQVPPEAVESVLRGRRPGPHHFKYPRADVESVSDDPLFGRGDPDSYFPSLSQGDRLPLAMQQVEALLAKAVKIDRKCVDAYLQLGILDSSQHNYEKAIDFYTKAIEIDPQLGEAHYRLGMAYDRTGEPAKAKTEFVLHDEIEKQNAAAVERQRREIKQFLVVLQGQPTHPTVQ